MARKVPRRDHSTRTGSVLGGIMIRMPSRVPPLASLAMGVSFLLASSAAEATDMFRFSRATSGEHFYTATFSEGVNAGFKSEGIGFRFYSGGGIGRIPIYRCYAVGWHFISTLSNCEGATVEGQYGWIDSGQLAGTVALKRFYRTAGGDHFYTTDDAEASAIQARGYVFESIIGYVPIIPVTTATGLACDGSTDDTAALQNAIYSAQNGHLVIPAGSSPCMV